MKKNWATIKKDKKRLKLTLEQSISHYLIVISFFIPLVLIGKDIIELFIAHSYSGINPSEEIIEHFVFVFFLTSFFAYIQYNKLNFKEYIVHYTEDQFQEAIHRTIEDLDWKISKNNKKLLIAIHSSFETGSWGEMITILKSKDKILINSICDPNTTPSIISYGMNKKNIKVFLTNLENTINNIPKESKNEEITPQNEWTIKRTFIRIIAYIFCLLFIILGISMIFSEPLIFKNIYLGITIIIIALTYLYADIKIILTQK